MRPGLRDGDLVLVCDKRHSTLVDAQWRQVSHIYNSRVWYKRNDGLPGFAGSREESCCCSQIQRHVSGTTRSLTDVLLYNAPAVCKRLYGRPLLVAPTEHRWWLYIPKCNEEVDGDGGVCPYIHRAWTELKPIFDSRRAAKTRLGMAWLVTMRTHFEAASADEICFRVHYLPNHLLRGVHVCELAGIRVTIEWEIHPCNGFVRIAYKRDGEANWRRAFGRIVCNTLVDENLRHMALDEGERRLGVEREYRIERLLEGGRCVAAAAATAARVAMEAMTMASESAVVANRYAGVLRVVRDVVDCVVTNDGRGC